MFQVHNNYYPAAKVIYYSEMSKFYEGILIRGIKIIPRLPCGKRGICYFLNMSACVPVLTSRIMLMLSLISYRRSQSGEI